MISILSFLLLLSIGVANAAITVNVVGSTNVQAVLSYESPVDQSCTVQVSESPDFKRLVHDVNPDLFSGADSDARAGSVSEGRRRLFVAGRRAVDQAADGKWYSRALQTATLHYFRVRCGDDTGSGMFTTANIPVGITYPWAIPQDPRTGQFRWPSVDNTDRGQAIIDPNYGTLIRRVSVPGDGSSYTDLRRRRFRSASGNGWTSPELALADDGAAATLSGNARDWLILTDSGISLTPFYTGSFGIDFITVRIKGDVKSDERRIELCLTLDGAACSGEIRSATLENDERTVTLGTGKPIDTWGEPVWPSDLTRSTFGVMIRNPGTTAGPVEIQYVEMDIAMSERVSSSNAGFVQTCAPVKSNDGFHCAYPGDGGSNMMYWIHPGTGEVRWLGKITATGWGGPNTPCRSGFAMFDSDDPNVYYCSARLNGKTVLLKGTYKGNDAPAASGATARMDWDNLTPDPRTISDLVREFNGDYDPAQFACSLAAMAGANAVFQCRRGNQDSIGWLAVFDLGNRQPLGGGGTGRIAGAAKSFASPNTRWCGLHAVQPLGPGDWVGWSANTLGGGGEGGGPYSVTLASPLAAGAGTQTVQVSGEPQPYLMDVLPGDVFRVAGVNDFLRIVEKHSANEWVVERTVTNTQATARDAGTRLNAVCNAQNLDTPTLGPYAYWNFRADPYAADTTNTNWAVEKLVTGGHMTERGNYRIMAHYQGYQVVTPAIPQSLNHQPSFRIFNNPRWAGLRASTGLNADGLGNIYAQHPSFENWNAPGAGRNNWFVDFIPFVGTPGITPSVSQMDGFSQVYKANSVRLSRDQFPTIARCGGRQLKEIAGPITDRDVYTFCIGGACAPGAGNSDVFVNCPAPISTASRCTESMPGDDRSVCVGDLAPYGQSITQFFLDASGMRNRVLSNGLFAWHAQRTNMTLDTASPLPDGSWIVFPSFANNARKDLYMVKVPPQPNFDPDPGVGSQPVPMKVAVTPPSGAARVTVQYGATPNLGSAMSGSCAGDGCSVTLPMRPLDLIFTRSVPEDSNGQKIGDGKTEARISGGISGSGMGKPRFAASSVVNSASFEPKLAPGAMVSIFGETLAGCEAQASSFPLPASLCDTAVTFNDRPAVFFSASSGQLNVLLPSSLAPGGDVNVVIDRLGQKSDPQRIPGAAVAPVAPAIFAYTDGPVRRAILQNPDGAVNAPERPLKPGDAAVLYANGLGPTDPPVSDGQAAPADPPATLRLPVEVYVNDTPQPVSFGGLMPGANGVYQVNFTLDPGTPVLDNSQVWLRVAGVESPRLAVSYSRE